MKPQTKKEYLEQLVSEKSQWSRRLTDAEKKLGFLGWHERGYLPHCDFPGLVQLVTFRLRDSMPLSRRGEWEHLLKIEEVKARRSKLDEYLDKGVGNCDLRDAEIAQLAEDALLYFDQDRYALLAWCIMPNHVHVLFHVRQTPLSKVIQSWKIRTASQAGRSRHVKSSPQTSLQPFWQREYWDTYMRNSDQERNAIKYIEMNPVKSRLCHAPENWPFSSARYRDKFSRLKLPKKEIYVG